MVAGKKSVLLCSVATYCSLKKIPKQEYIPVACVLSTGGLYLAGLPSEGAVCLLEGESACPMALWEDRPPVYGQIPVKILHSHHLGKSSL